MASDERKKGARQGGGDPADAEQARGRAPQREQRDDDAAPLEPRHGIPGKGFDAGTGYGGAGGSSAYSGESSYGGQAGYGGSTTRGAYGGGRFGRPDDPGGAFAGRGETDAGGTNDDATGTGGGDHALDGDDADASGGASGRPSR